MFAPLTTLVIYFTVVDEQHFFKPQIHLFHKKE